MTQGLFATPRDCAFAASICTAIALNGCLLGLFSGATRTSGMSQSAVSMRAASVTVLGMRSGQKNQVISRSDADPELQRANTDSKQTAKLPIPKQPPIKPPLRSLRKTDPMARASVKSAEASVAPLYFYSTSEVDRPAMPEQDWNLDTAALDVAGIARLVFDVFIDSDGVTVAAKVIEPQDLDPVVAERLESRLLEGAAHPALRAGAAVASTRRIEMSVLPSGA